MYCEVCGHELNENGFCPICNWGVSTTEANSLPHTPIQTNSDYNQYNSVQPQYQQVEQQVQYPQQPYQQVQQQIGYPQQQYQQVQQQVGYPQQQYQQVGQQVGYPQQQYQQVEQQVQYPQQQYQQALHQQEFTLESAENATKKKSKLPLIIGISLAVILLVVIIVLIIKENQVKDYTKDKTTDSEVTTELSTEPDSTEPATSTPVVEADEGTKTIMMYVVGSDLESNHGCASTDIDEILDSNYDDENITIVIYTGGSYDWDNSDIPDDGNSIILVENGDLTVVEEEDRENMGDADTLTDFLAYGYENYPADQYSLVLWNHGGGAFFGYGYDETTNDCLTLEELDEALAASPFNEENPLEWIGFDACLMATVETAHILSPYSKYMIASQESEPGWGWDYSFLADIEPADTGAEVGTYIVDRYIAYCEESFDMSPFSYSYVTLSVLDLSETVNVEAALNDLFEEANDDLSSSTFAQYSRIRSKTKEIASEYTGENSYDVVDMVDLSKNMRTTYTQEANALESALNEFIVYNGTNETNASGVSIYFPYNAKDYSNYYIPMYSTFDFALEYTSFITNFSVLLTGEDTLTAEWDPQTMIPTHNGDLSFSLELTPEQAGNVQNIYYVISREDTQNPGNYMFVSMSNQVTLDASNVVTADFDGEIIYIQNDTTLEQYEIMYTEQESTDDYTRYLLTSILYDDDIMEEDAMYAYFAMETSDAYPEGQILGAYPIANYVNSEGAEVFPERYEIDIYDYNYIAFGCLSHEFTSEEDLTEFNEADWEDLLLLYNTMPVGDGFSTVLGDMLPGVAYYGMFIFEDLQGNRHCSNLVQIQ